MHYYHYCHDLPVYLLHYHNHDGDTNDLNLHHYLLDHIPGAACIYLGYVPAWIDCSSTDCSRTDCSLTDCSRTNCSRTN